MCYLFTATQQAYGKYMWMPIPSCTQCVQYFGLITKEQKQLIDSEFTEECTLMILKEFTEMTSQYSLLSSLISFSVAKGSYARNRVKPVSWCMQRCEALLV